MSDSAERREQRTTLSQRRRGRRGQLSDNAEPIPRAFLGNCHCLSDTGLCAPCVSAIKQLQLQLQLQLPLSLPSAATD